MRRFFLLSTFAAIAGFTSVHQAEARTFGPVYNPPGRSEIEKVINHATRDAAEALTGQECHWEAIPNETPNTGRWRRKQLVCE